MHEVQDDLPLGPGDPDGPLGGDDASADGDAILRADAERLGYLKDRYGMDRYLREHGILPTRYLERGVREKEVTGLALDRFGRDER